MEEFIDWLYNKAQDSFLWFLILIFVYGSAAITTATLFIVFGHVVYFFPWIGIISVVGAWVCILRAYVIREK